MIAAFFRFIGLFLLTIPAILFGLPIVALAIPFRITDESTRQAFTQYAGEWMLVTLPAWAKPWDNKFDGAWGDKRGWWDNECKTKDGRPCTAFASMWKWLALRNSANWFKRVFCGIDMAECVVSLIAGQEIVNESAGAPFGWQLLKALRKDGKIYPRFFCVMPYKDGTHAFVIDLGWKIKMSHNGTLLTDRINDRLKGLVFCISPRKEL